MSRLPNAGPSVEESHQPPDRELGTMELISVGSRFGSTGEPQRVWHLHNPITNPFNTQSCATPTVSESDFQIEAQEWSKKLEAFGDWNT